MGGHGHSSHNTVINNNIDKDIRTTTDNIHNTETTINEKNTYTNTLNGDKSLGGNLRSESTVNTGTAIYALQNLSMMYGRTPQTGMYQQPPTWNPNLALVRL